jgi:hypothetical protein
MLSVHPSLSVMGLLLLSQCHTCHLSLCSDGLPKSPGRRKQILQQAQGHTGIPPLCSQTTKPLGLGLKGNQEPLVTGRQEKQRKSWGALGRSSLKVGPSFGNQQTFASSLLLHFQRKGVAIKQRVARFVLVPQPPQPLAWPARGWGLQEVQQTPC